MLNLCYTYMDLIVAIRIHYGCAPSLLDEPLYFPIPVSLARPSEPGHPPTSVGGWIRPVGEAIGSLDLTVKHVVFVLTVRYRIYSLSTLHPRLVHLPNNPGTRAIVSDPDMRVLIWSGGGKRDVALPHGHPVQDDDRKQTTRFIHVQS